MIDSEADDADGDIAWDDAVDVICVGSGPGVLAYATACAAADLDVILVGRPDTYPDDVGQYLAAMTDDLTAGPPPGDDVVRARPAVIRVDRRTTLDPFVGADLRAWSAQCLASPSGVLFTRVPDDILVAMRTDAGELIAAAPVPDDEDLTPSADTLAGLVYQDGLRAGAVLDGPSGRRLVRADAGLAFPVGAETAEPAPAPPGTAPALVGRPAGRFARLGRLASGDGDG